MFVTALRPHLGRRVLGDLHLIGPWSQAPGDLGRRRREQERDGGAPIELVSDSDPKTGYTMLTPVSFKGLGGGVAVGREARWH